MTMKCKNNLKLNDTVIYKIYKYIIKGQNHINKLLKKLTKMTMNS